MTSYPLFNPEVGNTVGYARMNVIGSRTSFFTASFRSSYIKIYVFRGNPFQVHGLEQRYHQKQPFKQEKYNTKFSVSRQLPYQM